MANLPVDCIFKEMILDSLMKYGFIQSSENFLKRNKKLLLTGATTVVGIALGPLAIGGIVAAIGFGEAGIAAGSIAAWMMSLHRGYVAAGSLVAILQSIGAVGLGIGGVVTSSLGGGIFTAAIAKALLNRIESNPEGLAELENFVSITTDEDNDSPSRPTPTDSPTDSSSEPPPSSSPSGSPSDSPSGLTPTDSPTDSPPGPPPSGSPSDLRVIFDMKSQILDSNEKLESFFKGFDLVLARELVQDRTRKFEFLVIKDNEKCLEGSNFLHNHIVSTYGDEHVTLEERKYILNLSDQ